MEPSATACVAHSVCSPAYGRLPSSPAARRHRRLRRKPAGLGGRCYAVLKQHKTRLYILGRCVSMLLCWHDDRDAD